MSRWAEVTLDWGGEPERVFRLGIGQIGKLQEKLDAGPLGIAARCQLSLAALAFQHRRDWISLSQLDLSKVAEVHQVREVFIQALVGAKTPLPTAHELVREWVDERPLGENLVACIAICNASVYGVEDEKPEGESQVGAADSPASPTASSASGKPASTRTARRAASAPTRSTP